MVEGETVNPEIEEPISKEQENDFENAFDEFARTSSQHTVSKEKSNSENSDNNSFADDVELDIVDQFKIKMFLGLAFILVDGLHEFLYSMVTKYKIKKGSMSLDEEDQQTLEVYFQSKKMVELINKIPTQVIGIVHMEYIYYQKFKELREDNLLELKDKHKKKKVKAREEEEEFEEEEEEEQEEVEEEEEEFEELTDEEFEAQVKEDAEKVKKEKKSAKKVNKKPAKKQAAKKAKKK